MRLAAAFFYLAPFCTFLQAQSVDFSIDRIPSNVRTNASAIVRDHSEEFEVTDIDRATLKVHDLVTILNESAKDELIFEFVANKYELLDDVEIKVFDRSGRQLSKYKLRDIPSIAGVVEFRDDYKIYYLQIQTNTYPITVEKNYTIKYKGTLTYPKYQIQVQNEGVEHSRFTARLNRGLDLHYKAKHIQLFPTVSQEGELKTYTWTVQNLSAIRTEEAASSSSNQYPCVLMAPDRFKMDDFEGDMSSWKNFGLWYKKLLAGTNIISEDEKAFFQSLVAHAATDRQKEEIIYKYLQTNFRYVSIQLGIGGWRPLPANFTFQNKYGDCKGLSNYMQAALAAVGIKSYLALINAFYDQEPVDPGFPCNQFNHAILCIPRASDTTWLECTSKTEDFGILGSFTENRNALLITEDGGVLVSTPRSVASENRLRCFTRVLFQPKGLVYSSTLFDAEGEFKQQLVGLMDEKSDDQRSFLVNQWGFKQPQLVRFDSTSASGLGMQVDQEFESLDDQSRNGTMFIQSRVFNLCSVTLPKEPGRTLDYYFHFPYEKLDTTVIQLPVGFETDGLPAPVERICKYGSYSMHFWMDKNAHSVYIATKITLNAYRIPASDYAEVKHFFDEIVDAGQVGITARKM